MTVSSGAGNGPSVLLAFVRMGAFRLSVSHEEQFLKIWFNFRQVQVQMPGLSV